MRTEIHFEPTLFICLGTSSGQVGWRLKELLHQVYDPVPILRFLWIDADSTIDPAAAPWFGPMERAELTGFNGDEVLANLDAYPALKAWWPRESRLKPGFIRRGANQIRLHGRLALFRMFNDRTAGPGLIDKLRAATDALQQIENVDATERMSTESMRYVVDRGSVRVYLIFSTCGGTGSALAFDVAYLCRHLLRGSNPTIIGIALLPLVIDKAIKNETQTQREKIRANTYAWFKENDYLLENPYWHVEYPEGAPVVIQAPPFDLQFVVDLGNQAGDRLNSEDDIYTMVAQAIFLDTGSPIAGAIRGFNANVSVLLEEFQGRRRAYSSLAAASLVYPVQKILNYCSARLGQAIVRHGLLATPSPHEVAEAASALLGRLRMRDAQILETLLADRHVPNLSAPAIRKATSVEAIRRLLTAQEPRDLQERQHQVAKITATAGHLLSVMREGFKAEVADLTVKRGARFAQAVLDLLTAEPSSGEAIAETTLSLSGLKIRLTQYGLGEDELAQAEEAYRAAQQRLRALEGNIWQGLRRYLLPRSWQQDLDRARNDCLYWMTERNQRALQLAAQREAANLYDQLIEEARELRRSLMRFTQIVGRTVEDLEEIAQENLRPATGEEGIYELALEAVDAEYIETYYRRHATNIDPAAAYQAFIQGLRPHDLAELEVWAEAELGEALRRHAAGFFAESLENTSLLEALAEYYGDKAPVVIEAQFDRLVRYCHPFWQYNRDSGIQGHEGKSIIGVEDEHSDLIPAKYRDSLQYEIKSTGFKHRIDVARIQHGLPAFLLQGMQDYKAYYDAKRKGLDPLHILPEVAAAEEVFPEEKQDLRQLFAVAAAFGYVVQIGSWYYFDPRKEYEKSHIHPGRENRLDQGRERAEEAFIQRDDLVRLAEQLVEQDIVAMGNRAAIALLDARIAEHKEALAKMPIENELRRQYEKEIQALEAKQRQLGRISPELESVSR